MRFWDLDDIDIFYDKFKNHCISLFLTGSLLMVIPIGYVEIGVYNY